MDFKASDNCQAFFVFELTDVESLVSKVKAKKNKGNQDSKVQTKKVCDVNGGKKQDNNNNVE